MTTNIGRFGGNIETQLKRKRFFQRCRYVMRRISKTCKEFIMTKKAAGFGKPAKLPPNKQVKTPGVVPPDQVIKRQKPSVKR